MTDKCTAYPTCHNLKLSMATKMDADPSNASTHLQQTVFFCKTCFQEYKSNSKELPRILQETSEVAMSANTQPNITQNIRMREGPVPLFRRYRFVGPFWVPF